MNIISVTPRGFCHGVVNAYMKTKKILAENPNKKVYMVGYLVHNKIIVDELSSLGAIILDDVHNNRYDLIDKIEDGAIAIFSAHGTDPKTIDKAMKRNIQIFDLVCEYVVDTHEKIKSKLKDGYHVLFVGKSHHPETKSVLGIDDSIFFIETLLDIKSEDALKILNKEKVFVTNQTTLSKLDLKEIFDFIQSNYPNVEVENDLCNATLIRQEAVINLNSNEVDYLIVVGDPKSNNSKKLVQIGNEKNIKSFLVQRKNDIDVSIFKDTDTVAVTSGASTPTFITREVIEFLKEIKKG